MRLNIASATNIFPYDGWVNYDIDPCYSFINYMKNQGPNMVGTINDQKLAKYLYAGGLIDFRKHDLCKGFPQHENNSIDAIYLGQMIEHLNPIFEIPVFLNECFRMLKPGGVIRITTPDLGILIQHYINGQMNKFIPDQPGFYKDADPSSQLAYIMYGSSGPNCTRFNYEGHMFLFTEESMINMLSKTGYKNITFYNEIGKSMDPIMAEQVYDAGISHSLIVEAIK